MTREGATGLTPLLACRSVTKAFGGVPAVSSADLDIHGGEITAIVGENGAGKSTLMKVLAGVFPHGSYQGSLELAGAPADFGGVHDAEARGIVLVPQELRIAADLSIAENMFIGHLPTRRGVVDEDRLDAMARQWLEFFDIDIDPWRPAKLLPASEQRLAVIAGALSRDARLLILDEPTAAVTDGEATRLFAHMGRLRAEGLGIVFITHRLDEVEQVADRVVVMRNGEIEADFDEVRGKRDEIVRAMIGRDLKRFQKADVSADRRKGEVLLSVRGLTVEDPQVLGKRRAEDVSFDVRGGEIVGLYGLVGAGRTEVARAVHGTWPGAVLGQVTVCGVPGRPGSAQDARRRGLALVTEDRKATGIFPGHTLAANIGVAAPLTSAVPGVVDEDAEHRRDIDLMNRLDVRPRRPEAHIENLSGGNQQKVLLARALAVQPRVLVLDEPTLGVDVGARFEIYRLIREMAAAGLAVLLISSDVEEVVTECDRILVMYKGRVAAELPGGSPTHELVATATGGAA